MTVNAVTACSRFSADLGAVLGSRTTTGGVRRFAPDIPVTTTSPRPSNETALSAGRRSRRLHGGTISVAHCSAELSALLRAG